MLRLIALVAALSAALTAAAEAPAPLALMPGVTFEKEVQFTPHGPVVVDVITAPKPGGLYALAPVLAHGSISGGLERVTSIQTDVSATATVAGINGDFFNSQGYPSGIVLQGGTLLHGALSGRSSIGIDAGGGLHVKRMAFVGTWRGSGQRRPLSGANQVPRSGQVVLFTPGWGPSTPPVANSTEVILQPFPAATTNADLTATVTAQTPGGGGTPIPPDGAILMAVGSPPLKAEAPEGTTVTIRLILPPDWASVTNAIGGGPVLVKNGKAVFHTGEDFDASKLARRDARAGVGQLSDGRILLVAVDGNQPGYSSGLSTFELAQTMARLGAVTAGALDFGGSVTAAFDGRLLNRPRAGGRAVKEALLIGYFGVYAPPPPVAVLDKRNVATGQQLAYKIVRPSTISAAVVGPDGLVHELDSGLRQPGTYHFSWGSFDIEGTWVWKVSAVDDLSRRSEVEQPFIYDLTLTGLTVPKTTTQKTGLLARFRLSRPAKVTLQIETPAGTVLRTLAAEELQAGPGVARWDGTLDGQTMATLGAYVARLTATSEIGTMDLTAPFTLRR